MIVSRLRRLRFEKEEREGRKLTYETLQEETGLAASTLARLLKPGPIDRIDGKTLDTLCRYFGCGVGDVLEFVPEEAGRAPRTRERAAHK
jgi:DNA-binding Xre family transcriptional regulator